MPAWASYLEYRKLAKQLPEGLTFHSLRKTYSTALASAGVPFKTIQKMLGHSDVSDGATREQVLNAFNGVDL